MPDGCSVTVPVYAGALVDAETSLLITESLAPLGIKLTLQTMPSGQKRSLLVQRQVDMAVYACRPWLPDVGDFIYWPWLPDSLSNFWGSVNPEALRHPSHHPLDLLGLPEELACT